jgi:hypothetical protein
MPIAAWRQWQTRKVFRRVTGLKPRKQAVKWR